MQDVCNINVRVCVCVSLSGADSRTAWWAKNEVQGNCSVLSPEWQGCHDWGLQHQDLDTPAFFSVSFSPAGRPSPSICHSHTSSRLAIPPFLPSQWVPQFPVSPFKSPLCISLFSLPCFFPPCSLYQVLYNEGSPDVLLASIRHFDSVQLSMIMYCSLNHSFSLFSSFTIFLPVSLSLKDTCTLVFLFFCWSPL